MGVASFVVVIISSLLFNGTSAYNDFLTIKDHNAKAKQEQLQQKQAQQVQQQTEKDGVVNEPQEIIWEPQITVK